jgi:hypothetical protein
MKRPLLIATWLTLFFAAHAQTSYTWNGSLSSAWNTAGNWTPNGIPGSADNVTIVTGSNTCQLTASQSIGNFTLTSGTLDLGGATLTINGATVTFTKGTVQNGTLNVPAATTTSFTTGPTVMNCPVTISSASITIKNTTFQQALTITKTGSTNDGSPGGNVFNGAVTITNAGSGNIYLGNGAADLFNANATFNNTGAANLYIAYNSTNNIFNGLTSINNTPSGAGAMSVSTYSAGTQFNGNIAVVSNSGGGILFCNGNATATVTLAAGDSIYIGAGGFSAGQLSLRQVTQTDATPLNFNLTGTGDLIFGPSSTFLGAMNCTSPALSFNGALFNGVSSFTKTGSTGDWSSGGNVFNSTSSFTNSGSSYLVLGNGNPDTWNGDVTFTDNGSERLLPCWNSSGNQFNGNIYVNTAGSAQGIQFCGGSATATATLASGKTIQAGSIGLTAGYLYLKQFTQIGSTPINLTATASASMYLGPSSTFGGAITVTAPNIYAQGATYNGPAVFNKTGGASNSNNGYQNIFNSTCTINQQSSSGYFMLGNNSNDQFNDNITLTNTGTSNIYLGWNSGTGTLAAGKTIQVGSAGYSSGLLYLDSFTQLGTAPVNLTFTGTYAGIVFGHTSTFGGAVTVTAPDIYLNGAIFNGTLSTNKTGSNGDWSTGGNTFNDICTIANSSSGFIVLGSTNPDTWNADVNFIDSGSERILPGWSSTGNQFNGNIFVNTSGSAQGIQFCGGNTTSTATLAAGKTIQAGPIGLNAGYLILRQFTQNGNAPVNLTMSSTASYLTFGPSSTIGGNVVTSTPGLNFSGCTFNGTVTSVKNGASNDNNNTGNDIFNGVVNITDSGTGYIVLGGSGPDKFNAAATFTNAGTGNFYVAHNAAGTVFNGVTTFNNTPVGNNTIYVSNYSAGTTFNNNIVLNSTGGGGIQFCMNSGTANATLAAGYTMSVGSLGYTAGYLYLRQFTQLGAAPVSLTLTGTSDLVFGPASAFGGDVTTSSPALNLNGCTFNGASNLTKTGTTGDWSNGGNVFNGVSSITNSGTSYVVLGNVTPDTWNNDVTFTDNGTERLLPCWATAGNQFNGNIYVNTGGNAQGIQFCGGNTTSTAILAAGKSILAGSSGLNAGYLILKQFTQNGNAPVNLTLNSTATYLQFGPNSALGGNVVSSSPGLYFNGCTFTGTVTSTKTGSTTDWGSGNNIFNGVTLLTNAGTGSLGLGNGNLDQFNANATFNNTGTANIYVAYNSANNVFGGVATFNNTPSGNGTIYVSPNSTGTTFNSNIVVTSTAGGGVQFCTGNTTATAILTAGNTITVGPGGFSGGTLLLRQFTQQGSTPQSLTLTGTGNLTFGPSVNLGGNFTTVSPTLLFNGGTYNGSMTSTKNGTSNDNSIGNNTFNGPFAVTNTGSGYFLMGWSAPDTWQSTASFTNQSPSAHMYTAYNSTGNTFNGDVTFNNQAGNTNLWIYTNVAGINTQFNGNIFVSNTTGAGIYFGSNTGTATLTGSGSISAGPNGFTAGSLILKNFTQATAGTTQTIATTGTSIIQYGPSSSFAGPVTSSSGGVLFNSTTFNGVVNAAKTGGSNDQSPGNSTFNAQSTFTNSGSGYLEMTYSGNDTYNGNVTFVKTGSGALSPNYNNTGIYNGNVTVTSPAASAITFGAGAGTALFAGSSAQTINATAGSATPVISRLNLSNSNGLTLNTPVNVSTLLTLTSGLLNTTMTNILTMTPGAATLPGTALSTSYVNGPLRCQKASTNFTTLNFPVGTAPDCRPVVLTVNHSTNTLYNYTVQLFDASAAALGYTLPPSVDRVSAHHYYIISRTDASGTSQPNAGLTGNQQIQVFFGANDDSVSNGATLTIVKNTYLAPTAWIDIGGTGGPASVGGAELNGSITSTSTPSSFNSFSTFALADKIGGGNVLPTELLYFNAAPDNTQVDLTWATAMESNNDYFTVERSADGISFDSVLRVATLAPNGNSNTRLDYSAYDLTPLTGTSFYRLKQTSIDGSTKYSGVVSVNFTRQTPLNIYPNPSKGTVYVSGLSLSTASIRVSWYDLGGKLLLQQVAAPQGGMLQLNTHFDNGDYILKLQSPDGTCTTRTVIMMK